MGTLEGGGMGACNVLQLTGSIKECGQTYKRTRRMAKCTLLISIITTYKLAPTKASFVCLIVVRKQLQFVNVVQKVLAVFVQCTLCGTMRTFLKCSKVVNPLRPCFYVGY